MRQRIAVRSRPACRIAGVAALPIASAIAAALVLVSGHGAGRSVSWAQGAPTYGATTRQDVGPSNPIDALAAAPAPNVPRIGPTGLHVVRPGESLSRIARRYGLRPADLARLNGTSMTAVLLPGLPLWVPLSGAIDARALDPAGGPSPDDPAQASGDGEGAARALQPGRPGNAATDAEAVAGGRHTIQPGDTLYSLGLRFGIATDDLKRWNGLPADGFLRAGEELLLTAPPFDPAPPARTGGNATRDVHVVAPGDTLTSIAARFGTTVGALQRENRLAGDSIRVGQALTVPLSGSGPVGIPAGGGAKRIEVAVGEQRMYVWQGDTLVWSWVVSTGIASHPTRRGSFAVQSKIPNAWSSAWQLWMPNWLGIYWAGGSENGMHALPIINGQRLWAGSLGSPISYGCVVLGVQEAELLYHWAEIGTPVIIRD